LVQVQAEHFGPAYIPGEPKIGEVPVRQCKLFFAQRLVSHAPVPPVWSREHFTLLPAIREVIKCKTLISGPVLSVDVSQLVDYPK
jgi:hypothetical protein